MHRDIMRKIKSDSIEYLKPYEIEVDPKHKTGKPKRYYPKACFDKAFWYIYEHNFDEVKLCHGLYSKNDFFHSEHGWIEIGNDIVFDGVMQRFYNKNGYYEACSIIKILSFTRDEAIRLWLNDKNKCTGPWYENEEVWNRLNQLHGYEEVKKKFLNHQATVTGSGILLLWAKGLPYL